MGDPAGIGPEIIAAAWSNTELHRQCRPVAVGNPAVLRRAVALRGTAVDVVPVTKPEQASPSPDSLPCLAIGDDRMLDIPTGRIDARAGKAAYDAVVTASQLALAKRVAGMVTAPLQKEALHLAGCRYPGHTELLAEMCGTRRFAMVLYLGPGAPLRSPAGLAVVHVTLHMALRKVFDHLTPEEILSKARLVNDLMKRLCKRPPRIGVCALNPHAGEGGLFGNEEQLDLAAAIRRGAEEGLHIEGPCPADTVMVQARDGRFDAVVAMYHDQGHIALKLLGMHRAVNVTVGLPIVRTSVAHGTAFDIAGQGTADPASLLEAIRVAALLCRQHE